MAPIRQSRPDSGLGFLGKVLKLSLSCSLLKTSSWSLFGRYVLGKTGGGAALLESRNILRADASLASSTVGWVPEIEQRLQRHPEAGSSWQWLQRHPETGSSWPSWPQASQQSTPVWMHCEDRGGRVPRSDLPTLGPHTRAPPMPMAPMPSQWLQRVPSPQPLPFLMYGYPESPSPLILPPSSLKPHNLKEGNRASAL